MFYRLLARRCLNLTKFNVLVFVSCSSEIWHSVFFLVCLWYEQEKSSGRNAHYKLTSTVMLWLQTTKPESGTINLGGSLTRQVCCQTHDISWLCVHCLFVCCEVTNPHALFPYFITFHFLKSAGWNGCFCGRVLTPHRQHRSHGWSK